MPRTTQWNEIVTPELLSQVNPDNKRLQEDFLSYLRSIGRSVTTIDGYDNDLNIFFVWNLQRNRNKFFIDLTKRDVVSFQRYLIDENKNSPARVRRLKAVLSSMSNFIENILDDEYPGFRSIIRKIENPVAEPVREKTIFTDDQIDGLLDYLVSHKKYQQACAVALAVYSGARKSELPRFKVAFFDKSNIICGSLYKTPEDIKTKGRGNGKFIRKYILASKFDPYLKLWMDERERRGIDSEYLLVSKNRNGVYEPLQVGTLNAWARKFEKIMSIPFYWHACRHYYTTFMLRAGIPEATVVQLVGWDSSAMVEVYDDRDKEDEFSKYFDEGGIKQVEKTEMSDL